MYKSKGFTLVELLVVVLIIGVLSSIAMPMYKRAFERSRVAEARLNLKALSEAANRYYILHRSYIQPDYMTMEMLDIEPPANPSALGVDTNRLYMYAIADRLDQMLTFRATRNSANIKQQYMIFYENVSGRPSRVYCTTKDSAPTISCADIGVTNFFDL